MRRVAPDVFDERDACAQAGVSPMPAPGPVPKSAAKRILGAFPVAGKLAEGENEDCGERRHDGHDVETADFVGYHIRHGPAERAGEG